MDIIRIVAIGIVAAILALTLKKHNPEMSLLIGIAAGVIIIMMVVTKLSAVVDLLNTLFSNVDIDRGYIGLVLKIIGIAYIAEFGIQITKDAGQEQISSKIEIGAKVLIMVMSAPIIVSLVDMILNLLPA